MPKKSTRSRKLLLTDKDNKALGEIRVEMEAFFEFSFWLAEELEDLVARQQHAAAKKQAALHSRIGC